MNIIEPILSNVHVSMSTWFNCLSGRYVLLQSDAGRGDKPDRAMRD